MKLIHRFGDMTPERRPQDPHMDGTGLRFETMEHGGEYPDTMPSHQVDRCRRPFLHLRAGHSTRAGVLGNAGKIVANRT
jgi:hypothetical protein